MVSTNIRWMRVLRLGAVILSFALYAANAEEGGDPPQGDEHADHSEHMGHSMAGMQMMHMMDQDPASQYLMNLASGTAVNPVSWPMPMWMLHPGKWSVLLMANGFVTDTQESGPRGGDKLYSTNWFMAAAEHRVGAHDAFQGELMLSLEPATITDRRYPLLFQTGETAYGKPLADAQHPHNLIMSLGFHYVHAMGGDTLLDVYAAPVGDPAIGPVAYPHRASAMELPQAALSHHLQDSTHISYEVVTAGLARKKFKLEASGFHGAEPGENRWTLETGAIDSWSARLWLFPGKNWAAQVSGGRLTHPEALEPGDQIRTTASVHYTKPMAGTSWSSSLIWGRTHSTASGRNLNSYLAESVLPLGRKNFVTGRWEMVDRDELFSAQPEIEEKLDRTYGSTFRIRAFTIGYTRDVNIFQNLETGIGANVSMYSIPPAIQSYYGRHPFGGNVFVRFRIRHAGG
ncbi:MAG: hypothetical protein U0Q18_19560 [Bryobacteraceae bacterium]